MSANKEVVEEIVYPEGSVGKRISEWFPPQKFASIQSLAAMRKSDLGRMLGSIDSWKSNIIALFNNPEVELDDQRWDFIKETLGQSFYLDCSAVKYDQEWLKINHNNILIIVTYINSLK